MSAGVKLRGPKSEVFLYFCLEVFQENEKEGHYKHEPIPVPELSFLVEIGHRRKLREDCAILNSDEGAVVKINGSFNRKPLYHIAFYHKGRWECIMLSKLISLSSIGIRPPWDWKFWNGSENWFAIFPQWKLMSFSISTAKNWIDRKRIIIRRWKALIWYGDEYANCLTVRAHPSSITGFLSAAFLPGEEQSLWGCRSIAILIYCRAGQW